MIALFFIATVLMSILAAWTYAGFPRVVVSRGLYSHHRYRRNCYTDPNPNYCHGNYRDLRGWEIRFRIGDSRQRFLRVSLNGIYRKSTGFHWIRYKRHCWHLSFDWREIRGIGLSYGRML